MANALRINPDDSVVMAMADLPAGTQLDLDSGAAPLSVATRQAIPFGHKIAIVPIRKGEHVIKYGASIGVATQEIAPGDHVHVHNLATVRGAARS